jgi:hypothetical protein
MRTVGVKVHTEYNKNEGRSVLEQLIDIDWRGLTSAIKGYRNCLDRHACGINISSIFASISNAELRGLFSPFYFKLY